MPFGPGSPEQQNLDPGTDCIETDLEVPRQILDGQRASDARRPKQRQRFNV
jgi:hypothetical protein